MRYASINWTRTKVPKVTLVFGKQRYQIMGTEWMLDGIVQDHPRWWASKIMLIKNGLG